MRIAIAGLPRTGKTTLAERLSAELGYPVMHADDLISMGWSEASAELARRMLSPGPWIVEGVAVSRALRKALGMTDERPCDQLYFLTELYEPLSPGQAGMGTGCRTVHSEIAAELLRRGVQFATLSEHAVSVAKLAELTTATAAPAPAVALSAPAPQPPAAQVREPYASGSRWSDNGRGFG